MNLNTATDEALDHFAELLLKKIDGSFSSDERSYHEKSYELIEAEMEKRWMSKKKSYETAGEPNPSTMWNGPLPEHALEDFRKRLEAKDVEIDRLNRTMTLLNKKLKDTETAYVERFFTEEQFQARLAGRDVEIARLNRLLLDCRTRLDAKDTEIEVRDTEIDRLNAASDEKNEFIIAYRVQIERQFKEIDRLNLLVEDRGDENERLKSNIDALDRATAALRARYDAEHDNALKTIRELQARLADADKKTETRSATKLRHLWMVEDGLGGHSVWTKVGVAFENEDGSTHVELSPGLFRNEPRPEHKETP